MRRGIANYIEQTKKVYKAHVVHDPEFHIKSTTIHTNNKEQEYQIMKIIKDATEEGIPIYRKQLLVSVGFKRKPYITASNDLFDMIRDLSRQAYILFKYIIDHINYDNNYIVLSTDVIKHILNTSYPSIASKALHELINKRLICKCADSMEKNTYCINHQEYFKGNFTNFIIRHNEIYGIVEEDIYEDLSKGKD